MIHGANGRLDFVRVGESWTHDLRLLTTGWVLPADGPAIIASSVEIDPDRDEPTRIVSPVYQEIQRHEFSGEQVRGQCALLTGRVFKHIFSAALTLADDANEPAFTVLEIDVADRCREPVESLAATYLVRLGSNEVVEAGPHAITWSGGAIGTARLELRCDPPGRLALAEAGRQATRVQALADINPGDFTHRLRYRWRWTVASDAGPEITR
ncbi:MAG: hypothetical protein ACP5XB_30760 [Isosphaeraceae bacterium]